MGKAELGERAAFSLAAPVHEFLGMTLVDEDDPRSGVSLIPKANALNALGLPHAGVLSTLLELAAYLALLPELASDENAVTHQFSVSFLARGEGDVALVAKGEVLRRTRRLAFVSTTLHQADRLLASAQVTKSIFEI
jgi:uncharacterized protein (TIGR00369 family)